MACLEYVSPYTPLTSVSEDGFEDVTSTIYSSSWRRSSLFVPTSSTIASALDGLYPRSVPEAGNLWKMAKDALDACCERIDYCFRRCYANSS